MNIGASLVIGTEMAAWFVLLVLTVFGYPLCLEVLRWIYTAIVSLWWSTTDLGSFLAFPFVLLAVLVLFFSWLSSRFGRIAEFAFSSWHHHIRDRITPEPEMSRQMRQFENEKDLDYIGTVNRQFGHIRLWIRITRTSAINLRLIASLAVAFIAFRLPAEPVGERSIMAVAIGSAGFLLAALAVLAWHRLTQLYFATISQRVLKATKPPIERGHVAKP